MSRRSSAGRSSSGGTPNDKSLEKYTYEQVENMVNQCVHSILVLSQKRMPVKRSDITRLVCQGNSRATKPIVKKAESKLRKVFGLNVAYSQDGTKIYISNNRNEAIRSLDCISDEIYEEQFVLFVVLSAIIMSNSEETMETDLITLLGNIGMSNAEQAKKYLDKLTKQDFITCVKKDNPKKDTKFYIWSDRAHYEIDKKKLFEHFEELYESKVKELPPDEE